MTNNFSNEFSIIRTYCEQRKLLDFIFVRISVRFGLLFDWWWYELFFPHPLMSKPISNSIQNHFCSLPFPVWRARSGKLIRKQDWKEFWKPYWALETTIPDNILDLGLFFYCIPTHAKAMLGGGRGGDLQHLSGEQRSRTNSPSRCFVLLF